MMKILYVMTEGIGNMVMSLPTIQALKSLGHEIGMVCKELSAEIIPDGVVSKYYFNDWLNMGQYGEYDAVAYSFWSNGFREHVRFYNKRIIRPMVSGNVHEADWNFDAAWQIGHERKVLKPICAVEPIAHDLPQYAVAVVDGYVNEHWARKSWPHSIEFAKLMASERCVYLIGNETDRKRNPVGDVDPSARLFDFRGQLTLRQSSWMLSQMSLVVANDTGLAHVAASHGVPTYVLYGPSMESKNKPLGENVHVISKSLGCSPCQYTNRWASCVDWRCMDIKPEEIYRKVIT